MLEEFYRRYPLGRVWSELMTIHEGQYLVRVVLFDGDRPLMSALAMGMSVETAEDLARERSLSLLLQSQPPQTSTSPESLESQVSRHRSDSTQPQNPTFNPSISTVKPSDLPKITSTEKLSFPKPTETVKPPESSSNPEPPTDDSDLLVQTTLELRRLGWDAEQGRVYLEQTYGKRSRQQLTRPELESFLAYLQGMGNS
ncbi:MAG: hypothetical protein ACLFM4_13330 [Phormidium sp.]